MAEDLMDLLGELREQMEQDGVEVSELDLMDWLAGAGLMLARSVDDSMAAAYFKAIKND